MENNGVTPIRPLELMMDEKLTNFDFTDHIAVWKNFMPESECKKFIHWYKAAYQNASVKFGDELNEQNISTGDWQFPDTHLGRKDKQIMIHHNNPELAQTCAQYLQSCLNHYVHRYGQLMTQHMASVVAKFQHTEKGGGYHKWHYESMGLDHSHRVIVWTIYLNDVPPENGGETEFLDQCRRVPPTTGTVVMWPAGYTHPHRGNTLLSGDKYILTGWYYLNS